MDVAAAWDIPNPYGLHSADFDHDVEAYKIALGFLSDLAGGSEETRALEANGASPPMVVMWSKSPKFRRVLDKCRRGAELERSAKAERDAEQVEREESTAGGQRFIPIMDMPTFPRSIFRSSPPAGSWGG